VEKHQITAYIYIILAVFLWATIEIVMKLIQNNSSPYLMNFFRFFIGGITLLIYAVSSHKMRTIWGFFKAFPQYYIPAAVIGLTGGLLLYSYGTVITQAFMSAAIISSNPIFISVYMIFLQGEKRSPSKIVGIILGFLGMLLIITNFQFAEFFQDDYVKGNLLVLAGTCFWVVDLILGKLVMKKSVQNLIVVNTEGDSHASENFNMKVSSLDFNLVTFLVASLVMLPYLIFSSEWNNMIHQSAETWLGLFYIGIFTTGIAYLFFFKGLESLEASKGSNFFYLKPIFATILAFFILNEAPSIYFYVGVVIEVIALILISNN